MFDFPASPNVGDVSNGYMFNGVGWAGGPIVATPQEQFIDLSGKSSLDIDVPSWAKAVHMEGSVFVNNVNGFPVVQVSLDGSTFITGSSYQFGGPYHDTGTSPYYGTQGATATIALYLSYPKDNFSLPHSFQADINLVVPAGKIIGCRAISMAYGNAAPTGFRTFSCNSYLNMSAAAYAVKKLRFSNGVPAWVMGDGSYVRIVWSGTDVPQTNGLVPEAPMDDNEYVRVNGVWRLKKQEFDTTGKTTLDITVPTSWTPKHCRLTWLISNASAVANNWLALRGSIDGTTFLAGAADYYNAGITGQGSPTGAVSYSVVTAYTYAFLDYGGENNSVGHIGHALLNLRRNANSVMQCLSTAALYSNTSGVAYRTHIVTNYLTGGFGAAHLKAFRIFLNSGVAMGEGNVIAEWL